ncbi:MAG: hypothetical protein K8T20_07920 [Planctomycetes bacterium]|nr:hypothetical protein [Planctomycetota bacterium]
MRRSPVLALLTLASLMASAQDPAPAKPKASHDPRPGMRWIEQVPEAGVAPVKLLIAGKESSVFELEPGGELRVAVPGENRLLVRVRREFESRTAPKARYSFTWKLDDAPEKKVSFHSIPHRTAEFPGKAGSVPGVSDSFIVEVPAQGLHEVVLRLPKDHKAALVFQFSVEQARRVPGADNGALNSPSAHKKTWWMGTTSRLRIGYDDNVFHFSHNDESGYHKHHDDSPTDKYDRMASIDDFYFDSEFDLHIISPQGPIGRVTIGGQVNDRLYFQNHRKNVDEYIGYVQHTILDSLHYKIFGSFTPDRFIRNYDIPDVPGLQRAHAYYDDYTLGARVWTRPVKGLSAAFTYTWELEDWNGSFNERDSKANHFDLGLHFTPWPWVTANFGYEFTMSRALATGDERDATYREHAPRVGLDFKVKRLLFGASYRYGYRSYTTDNPVAVDPPHAGRRDSRHEMKVYVGYMLGESSSLVAQYTRTARRTSLPGGAGSFSEQSFNYEANTLEITFELKWP